ncbi:MAG: hypothetical protein MUO40_01785 [Anaerolineaceae bacterium]|nr:hypothetical protein [Anaerolineaceae bacterium]
MIPAACVDPLCQDTIGIANSPVRILTASWWHQNDATNSFHRQINFARYDRHARRDSAERGMLVYGYAKHPLPCKFRSLVRVQNQENQKHIPGRMHFLFYLWHN